MEYGPIPASRYEEVIEHLRFNFFPDEPLNKSVNLCGKGKPHAELEAHSIDTLKDEMSVMAVDKATGKVIFIILTCLPKIKTTHSFQPHQEKEQSL